MERKLFLCIDSDKKMTKEEIHSYFLEKQDVFKSISCDINDKVLREEVKKITTIIEVISVEISQCHYLVVLTVKDSRFFSDKYHIDVLLFSIFKEFEFTKAIIFSEVGISQMHAKKDGACIVISKKIEN